MRIRTFELIASAMEKKLRDGAYCRLPPIRQLAVEWNVAYQTMWQAVNVLVKKGIAGIARGRRSGAWGNAAAPPDNARTAAGRLYHIIRDRIEQGIYKVNMPLPKMAVFAMAEHLSYATVAQSFFLLARDNLVHRRGRPWIAGPAPVRRVSAFSSGQHPTILAVMGENDTWSQLYQSPFVGRFMIPFSTELMAHSVQLSPAQAWRGVRTASVVPATIKEVHATIKKLDESYGGTIIHSIFPREDWLERWIRMLSDFQRPIVYFDRADKGSDFTRKNTGASTRYYRLHLDEKSAAECALQELARRGHTDIGIHGAELYDWGQRRSELIKKAAARFDPPMKITISGPAEKIWTRAARTGMDGLFVRLEKRAGLIKGKQTRAAQPDAVRRMVRREADSLLSLIERGCTALICLNDLFAHQYYLLFQLLCIRVPGDISLISFDNIPESINFPVSTIDFGFERLGYLAAHIFIGDISIRADRDGAIPGVCTLVDRGSIGQVQCRPRTRA